jgi:hypothetical protein
MPADTENCQSCAKHEDISANELLLITLALI